jgi:hypothetical protein
MAKLSAHVEIGRIEYIKETRAFMTDGKILRNQGFGWKKYATVKEGIDPTAHFLECKAKHDARLQARPALREYRRAMLSACGLSKRWKLLAAIDLMPNDADGIWSEVSDGYGDNISISVEEIVEILKLREACIAEGKAIKEQEMSCVPTQKACVQV